MPDERTCEPRVFNSLLCFSFTLWRKRQKLNFPLVLKWKMEKPFAGQIIPCRKMQLKKDIRMPRVLGAAPSAFASTGTQFCSILYSLLFFSLFLSVLGEMGRRLRMRARNTKHTDSSINVRPRNKRQQTRSLEECWPCQTSGDGSSSIPKYAIVVAQVETSKKKKKFNSSKKEKRNAETKENRRGGIILWRISRSREKKFRKKREILFRRLNPLFPLSLRWRSRSASVRNDANG